MNNNDQYFGLSNIDQYYNKIVEHIKESRDQLEEEKKKRGKRKSR
ncbi:MAG: hypothetical protein RMJ51_02660 [Candidatus Calescibacterium sp.]|nr:hypothetical protein [Candidatus Calescibacterium sp.]MCX7972269.1 hypothetical protein [bacterium]MDW8195129.1 hypothetical protein [Candidatus Calescibacterium sp.]